MATCRYWAQDVKEADGAAAKWKSRDRSQTKNKANGVHFGTEADVIPRMEGAECVEIEVPIEESVLKFCWLLKETALQPVSRKAKKEAQNTI